MTAGARQGRYRDEFLSSNQLADQDPSLSKIAAYISQRETIERVKHRPNLTERAPNVEIDDVLLAAAEKKSAEEDGGGDHHNNPNINTISLRHLNLKEFSLQLLSTHNPFSILYTNITELDVSNNELLQLPGLATLCNLQKLCLRRNWFNTLPTDIGKLSQLRVINASRNFLKPNEDSLRFQELKTLNHLEVLDVSLNQKCRTVEHRELIKKSIARSSSDDGKIDAVEVLVTIWQEMTTAGTNNTIGESAAVRNPALLRSQLEPWGTVNLRRRLVCDFGQAPTHPKLVDRAGVMEKLLRCYQDEGLLNCTEDDGDLNNGVGQRQTVAVNGVPVRKDLLDEILLELQDWRGNNKRGGSSNNRERPSIRAESYMILCAPPPTTSLDNKEVGTISRRERRRNKKMEGNRKLWDLAIQAMKETDPEFATRCSEIAVTYGFIGSPHIDRQNSSHFYGLSLGNFTEGTGCVSVEMSPRVVAEVNTKYRLGKVDGRYPHWVSNYNVEEEERFSLIYYDTFSSYQTPGPAIFSIPHER